MKKRIGEKRTVTTVFELREFISNVPDHVVLDLGFCAPVEIIVMADSDHNKPMTLNMSEEI